MQQSPEHGGRSIARAVRGALTERLPYKAAALFLAFVLWLVVASEEPTQEMVPVTLALTLGAGVARNGDLPQVHAQIVGPARELVKLFSQPPMLRRTLPRAHGDSIVLDFGPGDIELPSDVDAIVKDVQPRRITIGVDSVATRATEHP